MKTVKRLMGLTLLALALSLGTPQAFADGTAESPGVTVMVQADGTAESPGVTVMVQADGTAESPGIMAMIFDCLSFLL